MQSVQVRLISFSEITGFLSLSYFLCLWFWFWGFVVVVMIFFFFFFFLQAKLLIQKILRKKRRNPTSRTKIKKSSTPLLVCAPFYFPLPLSPSFLTPSPFPFPPAISFAPKGKDPKDNLILHFHGGGFVAQTSKGMLKGGEGGRGFVFCD